MQQRIGQESLGVKSTPNRPVLVDAGSVLTHLMLGQARLSERFPVITLHEGLEPEEANWAVELDDEGQHQIRTHVGRQAFRLDDRGGIERAMMVAGAGVIEVDGQESESFGGPGLLLPAREAPRDRGPARAGRRGSGERGGGGGHGGGPS